MELEGLDNWLTNAPDPIELTPPPCFICSEEAETMDAWLCYDCSLDLKAYDNIISYQTDTDITGYFIIEGKLIFIEFNSSCSLSLRCTGNW